MNGESQTSPRIIVAGGGITGLSTAYYLRQRFIASGKSVHITVLEQSRQMGGKIRTDRRDGFVLERGPDSLLSRKMPAVDLSKALGLAERWVGTNPDAAQTYILFKQRLHRMPPGLMLGIPTRWGPFLRSGLISPWGKVRGALDLVLPAGSPVTDEALGAFLERRLGREVVDRVAEPLLGGIYAGNARHLSLEATFPQFRRLEQKYRSLIWGMMQSRKQAAPPPDLPDKIKQSTFLSFHGGLTVLVEALTESLERSGVQLLAGNGAAAVDRSGDRYRVRTESGESLTADAVILTVPAYRAAALLKDTPGMDELSSIPYASVANVIMAFDHADVGRSLNATGFVVPRSEQRFITACTWTSAKWTHTAPQGKHLLRCYVGRSDDEAWQSMDDAAIVQKVKTELRQLMGIQAAPEWAEVNRWPQSMPQYTIGHLHRLERIRSRLQMEMPAVWLAGAGYEGVGIPDCIGQGRTAAERCAEHFLKKSDR